MTLVGHESSSVNVMEPASASLASPARKPLLLATVVACAVVLTIALATRWNAIIAWVDLPVLPATTGRQFERLLPVTVPTVLAFAALLLLDRVIPAASRATHRVWLAASARTCCGWCSPGP